MLSWQITLKELEIQHQHWLRTYHRTNITNVNEIMQELYPGPYRVVEKYLPDNVLIHFELEFDDPKEQTMWLLKNS